MKFTFLSMNISSSPFLLQHCVESIEDSQRLFAHRHRFPSSFVTILNCSINSHTKLLIRFFFGKSLTPQFVCSEKVLAMKRPASNEQVEISSDDSSSSDAEIDGTWSQQSNGEPALVLSSEAWLFRRAQDYQEYMKSITIPTNRGAAIPYTTWTGLGSSIKQMYEQPLHYLTNIQLKQMDRERLGADDEHVPLDLIIHPYKAEATIWLIEEAHRRTSSPHHLAQLWAADPLYHAFIDAIFPKLGS